MSPSAFALLNVGSSLAMDASFMWLNTRMRLNQPSRVTNWVRTHALTTQTLCWLNQIMNTVTYQIPNHALESLEGMPNSVMFCFFAIATAVFTGTTYAWVRRGEGTTAAKNLSLTFTMICLIVWIIVGVNTEELTLICLPQSINMGILSSCIFGGKNGGELFLDEENDLSCNVWYIAVFIRASSCRKSPDCW